MALLQQALFGADQTAKTSDDVFTPRWIFDRLGLTFDLDVAAPAGGVPYIPAASYYTKCDDAFTQPWFGRVWMNPPYSECTRWVHRFLAHGDGIALLPCAKSAWFATLWEQADGVHVPPRFNFANNHSISYPVLLAAMGAPALVALHNLGKVR